MRFCSNCGNKLEDNADICISCGKFVNNNINNDKVIRKNNKIGVLGVLLIVFSCIIGFAIMLIVFIAMLIEEDEVYYDDYHDIPTHEVIENSGGVGDRLYYKDLEFTLNSSNVYDYLEVNGEKKVPRDGYQYLVLNLVVRNNSEFNYNLDVNNFTGFYAGDEMEKVNIDGVNDNKILNGSIIGNKSIKGNIIFEIKSDWNYFELYYSQRNDSDRIIYKIRASSNNDNVKRRAEF